MPGKRPPARVSMVTPSPTYSSSSDDQTFEEPEPESTSSFKEPKIDTPPTERPATTLLSESTQQLHDESAIVTPQRKRKHSLSSSKWYKQSTAQPALQSGTLPHKEHPLLSTVTTAMQRQQQEQQVYRPQEDVGELQAFALEFEAYQKKMLSSFRRAAAFFERHYVSDKNTNTVARGTLVINDDGIIEEVRLAQSSGDNQIDYFLKEFFMSAKMPPLPPRLKGKPFLHPFSVECHMAVGIGTMRIFISS